MPTRRSLLAALTGLASAPASHADIVIDAPAARSSAAIRYWPVVTAREDWNVVSAAPDCLRLRCFSAPRPVSRLDNPTRRHVGVDLFARAGDAVVAIEDGRILNFYPFLRASTGEMSYALIVGHVGYVANYGEIRVTSLRDRGLSVGDVVQGGTEIGEISDTRQLHFETYTPSATRNSAWRYQDARPARVLDPTPLLLDLAAHGRRLLPGETAIAEPQ